MVQVGEISIGSGKPKICASITEADRKSIIAAADIMLQKRIDIVEWRLDFYEHWNQWNMVEDTLRRLKMSLCGKPLMVTLRTKQEGGNVEIASEEYTVLLERIADTGCVNMLDVEIFQDFSYEKLIQDKWTEELLMKYKKLQK